MTETTTSPERQRQDCLRVVEQNGWDFDPKRDIFEDWDRSAFSGRKRPGFDAMMTALKRGQYQRVVVWRVDRLSRSFSTWAKVFDSLKETGAVVVSASEGQSSDSGAYFKMLAVLAEEESERIRARVRSHRQAQFEEGKWPGGNRPFGWRPAPHPSGKGLTLALEEEEAALMREAVQQVLRGHSVRSITTEWNDRGIRTSTGGTWHPSRLRSQLSNPILMGHRTEKGRSVLDDEGLPTKHFPELVDAATFRRLQAKLAERTKAPTRTEGSLLAGIVKCGICGGPMAGRGDAAQGKNSSYYCARRAARGAAVCPGVAIKQPRLDEQVVEWTTSFLTATAASEVVAEHVEPTEAASRVAAIELRLARARELYLEGVFSRAEYDDECRRYEPALAAAQEEVAAAQQDPVERLRGALGPVAAGRDERELGALVREHWDDFERPQQRAIIRTVFDRIEVGPSTMARGMKGVPRAERWQRNLDRVVAYFVEWEGVWGVVGSVVDAALEAFEELGPQQAADEANWFQHEYEFEAVGLGEKPWWDIPYSERLARYRGP